jgi:hypothetical protein
MAKGKLGLSAEDGSVSSKSFVSTDNCKGKGRRRMKQRKTDLAVVAYFGKYCPLPCFKCEQLKLAGEMRIIFGGIFLL